MKPPRRSPASSRYCSSPSSKRNEPVRPGATQGQPLRFDLVLLAEIEVFHSRPVAPTRRVSLGHLYLPVDPLPGFGGLLLGAVVAYFLPSFDEELHPDLTRLVNQVERGERVVQPRLRHRFQVDHVGLGSTVHRLVGDGENISFELSDTYSPMQQVLGAIYATERLEPKARRAVAGLLHRAMRWDGAVGPSFIAYLAGVSGAQSSQFAAFADPVAWALDTLGFPVGTVKPTKREVTAHYRTRLIEVHPDHGGEAATASKLIADLAEARRILSA